MNMFLTFRFVVGLLLVLIVTAAPGARATELVYTPVNPSFGGSPNNASGLAAVAAAQNPHKAPTNSPLQNFNNSLQQAILSRLSSQALTTIFGRNSTLLPGIYDTSAYTITITQTGDILTIATTDKKTGATVSFEVSATSLDVGP